MFKPLKIWFQLPYFLLHLATCSTAHVSSKDLLRLTLDRYEVISRYVKKTLLLVSLGYGLADAASITMRGVKYLEDFFNRFSRAAETGTDLSEFMHKEYETFMSYYVSDYDKRLIRLRRLSDLFLGLLSLIVFLMVTFIASYMIWSELINYMYLIMPLSATLLLSMAFSYYISAPVEHIIARSCKGYIKILKQVSKALAVALIISMLLTCINTAYYITSGLDLIVLALSIISLVISLMTWKVIRRVRALEFEYPSFIKSFTYALSSIPSIREAMRRISVLNFGKLTEVINEVNKRLSLGLNFETSFEPLFKTNSELIKIHTDILLHCIRVGAPPRKVGDLIVHSFTTHESLRRKKDEIVAYLRGSLIPIHVSFGVVMATLFSFMTLSKELVSMIEVPVLLEVPLLQPIPVSLFRLMFYMMYFMMCTVCSLIMYLLEDRNVMIFLYYLSILLIAGLVPYILLELYLPDILKKALIIPIPG